MKVIILYSAPECGLCDEAQFLLKHVLENKQLDLQLEVVDIRQDINLLAKFSKHIPVLKNDNSLLYWPFDETQLARFLKVLT